jgi:tetratricopeptide (TPR) repeat protein
MDISAAFGIAVTSLAARNSPMSKNSQARAAANATGSTPPRPASKMFLGRWGILLAGGIIVLAALIVYHNSFSVPFIFDDEASIVDNPTIKHLGCSLSPPPDATTGGRPILNLTFALNYALGGMNVWGYHAFNLLFHTLAGLTLFGIVRRTLTSPALSGRFGDAALPLALAVALIWVVHPLQTESVTYVVQRAESLMGLFYLLMLYCFIRGTESRSQETKISIQNPEASQPRSSALWLVASIFTCLLGMASKEVMVSAPLSVMIYDRTFVVGSFGDAWRRRRGFYLGLASCWLLLGYLVASTGGTRSGSAGFDSGMPWWMYALTQLKAIVHYLRLSVWPYPLILDYGSAIIRNPTEAIPYALVVGLLVAGTVAGLRRRSAIAFAGVWFFAILAPSSSVVPVITETMAEHRMYLPLAAVIALVVLGLNAWIGRSSLIVFFAAAVGLGWLTIERNKDYQSELAIWSDTVAKCPDNARAQDNLGVVLSDIPGRLPEAISHYNTALRINPDYAKAHNNLGKALAPVPGRLPEAISQFNMALRIKPDFAEAYNNLGVALRQNGKILDAISDYKAALKIKPDYPEAHNNLGYAISNIPGRLPEAISEYQMALRLNPDLAEAHYNLGNAFSFTPGRLPDAISEYQLALRINPDYLEAYDNLGIAFGKTPGRLADAISKFEAALRISPDDWRAHFNLGIAFSYLPGRTSEATNQFEATLKIKPDYQPAKDALTQLQSSQR